MAKKTKKIDKKSKASAKSAKAVAKAPKKAAAKPAKKTPAAKKAKPAKAAPAPKAAKKAKPASASKAEKVKTPKPGKKSTVKVAPEVKEKKTKGAEKPTNTEVKAKKSKKAAPDAEQEIVVEAAPIVKDVVLTDAEGRELCRVKDCDQPWNVEGYCRYHYLLFWKKIQNRKKILSEGKLEQYIEELTSRYPLKFLELIRKDLSSEPDFFSAIQELDIDENNNIDEFEDENFMEEVRGISSGETERVDDEY